MCFLEKIKERKDIFLKKFPIQKKWSKLFTELKIVWGRQGVSLLTAGAAYIQWHEAAGEGSSIFINASVSFQAGRKGWIEPGQWYRAVKETIIVPVCLLILPQSFALEHLRRFDLVLVLEWFLMQHECTPHLQSANSVALLSAVSVHLQEKHSNSQVEWPAKVTLINFSDFKNFISLSHMCWMPPTAAG